MATCASCKTALPKVTTEVQIHGERYPVCDACSRIRFRATAGPVEGRFLALLPPRRDGQGRRIRVHVPTRVLPGEHLKEFAIEKAPAPVRGIPDEACVISAHPIVPARPPGKRGRRLRGSERKGKPAPAPAPKPVEPPAPAKGKPKKGAAAPPPPPPKPEPVKAKPVLRPRRKPAAYSLVLEI
ncbi:MAG: hypothetical protein L0216_17060 [Planctomycetales bacterium]|nr:hypothetical protein [Planctomycetales bacterium]